MTRRSRMSLIMGVIVIEQLESFALELEKLLYLTLFTLLHIQLLTNLHQTWSNYTLPQDLGIVSLWV